MYNVHVFINEERKCIKMMSKSVFDNIKGIKEFELIKTRHPSITKIEEQPFYIETLFSEIHTNLNPRFVLISAPGATGKSTFGKHLAYNKNAFYWNLADINIGDGTFQGTLYKAVGALKVSEYAQALQNGEATLVIDAFDEAELISGRDNVERFLLDAEEFLNDSKSASVVLLSRTETAQSIATLFKLRGIPYRHYQIGLFPKTQAHDFVLNKIRQIKEITPAIEKCVDEYFFKIESIDITEKNVANQLLGYAPVLEAIATHICAFDNTSILLNELDSDSSESVLIYKIMYGLLNREQEKLVSAFKERLGDDKDKVSDWKKVYSVDEQLFLLINYIIFEEVYQTDVSSVIPIEYQDDYYSVVERFLPQHPFIQNSYRSDNKSYDFAGPAFRDFSLAKLIINPNYEEDAKLYYQRENSTAHFPSQLFWNHYVDFNEGLLQSSHFLYLTEAFKAKTNINQQTAICLYQDEDESFATFSIVEKEKVISSKTLEINVVNNTFEFGNIKDFFIDIKNEIILGQNDNAYIEDSTISCSKIIFNSNNVTINSFKPRQVYISTGENIEYKNNAPNFLIGGDGVVRISIPNIEDFPKLYKYRVNDKAQETSKKDDFLHYLRKILMCFRTHKKDMPARDAEKIDFVIVGNDEFRKRVFAFLLDKGIVFKEFREKHLYKINLDVMSRFGINWVSLMSGDMAKLSVVYDEFIKYCNES